MDFDFSKDNFLERLNFETKCRNSTRSDADISIAIGNSTANRKRINLYIRNGYPEVFGEYIKFAIYKNRLIFIPAEQHEGFKLVNHNKANPHSCLVSASVSDIEPYRAYEGNFTFKYDDFYEFYYIERKDI